MYPILNNDRINEDVISSVANKYTYTKRNKKGKIPFNSFVNHLGHKKEANITSPLGHVKIMVHSQFGKMLFSKDNRSSLLFNIKDTLKNPLFVLCDKGKDEKGYYYVSSFKKNNSSLFHMVSVCKNIDNKMTLMTSYQIRNLGKMKKLLNEKNILFHSKKLDNLIILDKEQTIVKKHSNEKEMEGLSLSSVRKPLLIRDLNENRPKSNLRYSLLSGEQMFNDEVKFEEVFNNKEYFEKKKQGLKAVVVSMSPYDYIEAVELRQSDHRNYGASTDKLDNLHEVYQMGIKVDIPFLAYGSRDEAGSDLFQQEGYHRATFASMIGKKLIPVAIRYREDDELIPDFIKERISTSSLEIKDSSLEEQQLEDICSVAP